MIGVIVWVTGLLLTIKAALEIWRTNGNIPQKMLVIVLVIVTSWLGLAFYYFYAKGKISEWVE